MQTVAASVILEDAYRMIGWDPTLLDDQELAMARMAFSQALQELWERWWWEALMTSAPVQLAGDYNANWDFFRFYETGHPVYLATADWYYIFLWPVGASGTPDINPGEWARYNPCATGQTPKWDASMNPKAGDQCYFAGNLFQWTVLQGALANTQPDPTIVWVPGSPLAASPGWVVVKNWQPQVPFDLTTPDFGNGSGFIHTPSGPAGDVRAVTQLDPRTTPNCRQFHTREADDASGRVILDLNMGRPWVWARRVTPVITGDLYDATKTYDATAANDLVFDS